MVAKANIIALFLLATWEMLCCIKMSVQGQKCTGHDGKKMYGSCSLDYRDMTLWCDLTNMTRVPPPESINSPAPPSKSHVLLMNASCVDYVEPDVLGKYQRLKVINLSDNFIKSIQNGTLTRKEKLKQLDLSNNQIELIDKQGFKGAPRLMLLNLTNNQLTSIDPEVFQDIHWLEKLFLDQNHLGSLEMGWFVPLRKLKDLSVARNNISSIHPYKHRFPRLKVLNLDGNHLTLIDSAYFKNMPALKFLSLQNNRLSRIEENAFEGKKLMTSIDLRNNLLESLPRNLFTDLCKLRELKISGNRLTTIEPQFVINVIQNDPRPMTSLLASNNWNCSCNLFEYWKFLKDMKERENIADVECLFPQQLAGVRLSTLSIEDFCPGTTDATMTPSTNTSSSSVEGKFDPIESYLSVDCKPSRSSFETLQVIQHPALRAVRAMPDPETFEKIDFQTSTVKSTDITTGDVPLTIIIVIVIVTTTIVAVVIAYIFYSIKFREKKTPSKRTASI
ncbi:unnamed protein product [Clavelina lepadiformis]|uniref:Uncharacterized protein n=1 Tax=Clavelina lepadiformis TaxID=159417 RepID=A0ABP0F3Y7_CLALP